MITMTIREYYQQFCLPKAVSNHRLWVNEKEASTVTPVSTYVPVLYYRVTFADLSTVTLHKNDPVTVEIIPGRVTNR